MLTRGVEKADSAPVLSDLAAIADAATQLQQLVGTSLQYVNRVVVRWNHLRPPP